MLYYVVLYRQLPRQLETKMELVEIFYDLVYII